MPAASLTLAGPEMDKVGLSLSAGVPGGTVPVPSSLIVPTPVASAMLEPVEALERLTLKASLTS